jgi:hypothetical protein
MCARSAQHSKDGTFFSARQALEADGVIAINRMNPHTDFQDRSAVGFKRCSPSVSANKWAHKTHTVRRLIWVTKPDS